MSYTQWQCPQCTLLNPSTVTICGACEYHAAAPPPRNPQYCPPSASKPEAVADYRSQSQVTTANDASQHNDNENPHTSRQLKGAAVAGGVAGLVLVGPVVGVAAAAGAAYAVTAKGEGGNIARNVGDAVADAGVRLKRFNRKHHVVEKTTTQVSKATGWAAQRLKPRQSSSPAANPPS